MTKSILNRSLLGEAVVIVISILLAFSIEALWAQQQLWQEEREVLAALEEEFRANLEQVETVGAYAVQFVWSDGHSTGIYSWELLRASCPCQECIPTSKRG